MNHSTRNKDRRHFACYVFEFFFVPSLRQETARQTDRYIFIIRLVLARPDQTRPASGFLVFWFGDSLSQVVDLGSRDRLDIKCVTILLQYYYIRYVWFNREVLVGEETADEHCHKQRKEGKDYQDIDRSDQPRSSLSSCQNIK